MKNGLSRLLHWSIGFAAILGAGSVSAQTPAPLAHPNLDLYASGSVHAIAHQPDGGVILAGDFRSINGTPRNNIARLRPDGTVDPIWVGPDPFKFQYGPGRVDALVVDVAGSIYVGGGYWGFVGAPSLVKLSGTTGEVDSTWQPPNHLNSVAALAVDANDNVYVLNGGILRLSASTGAVLDSWDADVDGHVDSMAVDVDGTLYAGGSFTTFAGQPRSNIARVRNGVVDAGWTPSTDGIVGAIAPDACGGVYIGGAFQNVNNQPRSRIAKLAATTGVVQSNWKPAADGEVVSLAVGADCAAVYAGGYFANVGGLSRHHVAKLSGDAGNVDAAWNPAANDLVLALTTGPAGRVYAGGFFDTIGGESRLGFATLTASNGQVGPPADAEYPGYVTALAAQPGGGVIVGGSFAKAGVVPRRNLLRLTADGRLDPDWTGSIDFGHVNALAVGPGDEVYVGGGFIKAAGVPRKRVAKFSGRNGALDMDWDAAADDWVYALAVDESGAVYAGGAFKSIGGQPRLGIAKLTATTGSADPGWNPSPPGDQMHYSTQALAVDNVGSVYASGRPWAIGGLPRPGLAKLSSATGAADPAWNPSCGSESTLALDGKGSIYAGNQGSICKISSYTGQPDPVWRDPVPTGLYLESIVVDASGGIYAGGGFYDLGGLRRAGLAKISSATGVVDANWNPGTDGTVSALTVDAGGTLYVGGYFQSAGGQPRAAIAAFPADVAPERIRVNGVRHRFDPRTRGQP